jgi:hypothetical protein
MVSQSSNQVLSADVKDEKTSTIARPESESEARD